MILLAIDPSLRATGYGLLLTDGKKAKALAYGTIRNAAGLSQSACLVRIHEEISDLIVKHKPVICAVEGVIYVQSYRTAITLGAARGAVILAAAQAGLPVYEYAPRRVKQSVVGKGAAQKTQVAFMVRTLLELRETPSSDAADALAIGLTCIQELNRPTVHRQKTIHL